MSQYLSNFYCGNKKNLCNFHKPIEYNKMLNRQFDMGQYDIVNNCKGYGKTKGYCCNPLQEGIHKPMDKKYMEHLNKEFGHTIFHKNDNGNIEDSVPLVKTIKNSSGEIHTIDVCQCGGEEEDYKKCVKENCKDYKIPSRYEYCKMGNSDNTFRCFTDVKENESYYFSPSETFGDFPTPTELNTELTPAPTIDKKDPNSSNKGFGRCKLSPLEKGGDDIMSTNFRINKVYPDCYLNLCSKTPGSQNLENVAPDNYNHRVHNLGSNESMGFREINNGNRKRNEKKSIADFLIKK
jgi:hypothetical protein